MWRWILCDTYQAWEPPGKLTPSLPTTNREAKSPRPPCWSQLAHWACISSSDSADCDGWDMCTERRTVAHQRIIIMYGGLTTGHPALRFQDVSKWDLGVAGIDPDSWELHADGRSGWRHVVREEVRKREEKRNQTLEDRRRRKQRQKTEAFDPHSKCLWYVKSGLMSHSRRCF